ncbi:unnamed protein product [Soboliphyme baturini]|uniref:Cytosolic protein n=1 Tax=Soboliphyme baturini TaxID=241478 RepID=A0A183IM77_9BILA|nr:unnamed protein product [Soboliphyme baturini]
MDIFQSPNKSPGSVFEQMVKDAYYGAKRQANRSQTTIDDNRMQEMNLPSYGTIADSTEDPGRNVYEMIGFDQKRGPVKDVWVANIDPPTTIDYEPSVRYGNRRHYKRYGTHDPLYFNSDLEEVAENYRYSRMNALTARPKHWEYEMLQQVAKVKGEKAIAPYLFVHKDMNPRSTNTSLLSAALRTPSYWTYRFQNLS